MVASAVDSAVLVLATLTTGICVVETVIPVLASVASTVVKSSTAVSELAGVDESLLLGLSIVVRTEVADVSNTGTVGAIASEEVVDVTEKTGVSDARGVEVDSACRTLEDVVTCDTEAAEEVANSTVDVDGVVDLDVVLTRNEGVGKLLEESPVDDAVSDLTVDVDSGANVLREVDTGTDVEKPSVVAVALPSVL